MQRPAHPQLDLWTKRWVLWCLLLALPLGGLSAATAQMLGAKHLHRGMAVVVVSSMDGWQDFRRSPHLSDTPRPAHPHAGFQRHHHGIDDATVVALDAQVGESPADVGSGTACAIWLVFSPSGGLDVPQADLMRSSWRRPAVMAIQSCDAKRLERPPQA